MEDEIDFVARQRKASRCNFDLANNNESWLESFTASGVLTKLGTFRFSLMPEISIFDEAREMNIRRLIYRVLKFAMIIFTWHMFGIGLMVVAGVEKPLRVLLHEGMEPAFSRGDTLFITNYQEDPIRTGEIIAFKIEGREIPIVHRVIKVHELQNGTSKFLTKDDNSQYDDRGLYPPGQLWLTRKDVVGRVRAVVPYVGMIFVLFYDYRMLKYLLLVGLVLFVRRRCK
uniref:Signal peptidase complex catalytic subunit SEC11 n=1 Tax=Plectus sambesii TaxID=2011161 RepID=A0A914UQ57_9BILA